MANVVKKYSISSELAQKMGPRDKLVVLPG
jgi:hypothetical protein